MKLLNKGAFFYLLPKLNVLLIISAAILTFQLYSSINRTYDVSSIESHKRPAAPLELMANKGSVQDRLPLFDEDVFMKKQLFNPTVTKKPEEKKKLVVQGVSIGKKNIAVIRDIKANKDYYCSEGDLIGEYHVKQILKDKVILESESGTLEIER